MTDTAHVALGQGPTSPPVMKRRWRARGAGFSPTPQPEPPGARGRAWKSLRGPRWNPGTDAVGVPQAASFELGEGCARLSHRTLSGKARLRQLGAPDSPSRLILFKGRRLESSCSHMSEGLPSSASQMGGRGHLGGRALP